MLGQRREGFMRVAGAELPEGERGMAPDVLIVEERDQDRNDPLVAGPGETQDHHLPAKTIPPITSDLDELVEHGLVGQDLETVPIGPSRISSLTYR